MDQPTWDDLGTPEEWAELLEEHAETVAHKHGAYSLHSDLRYAAQCIRDLAEQRDELRKAGGDLMRQVMAAKESLTGEPR